MESTTSKKCSLAYVAVGAAIAVGVAAVAWSVLSRRNVASIDPLKEADRRIDALEDSLRRLQDTFSHAVGA